MIPDTDVRKGWWINASLESPLLDHMDWDGVTGSAISSLTIPNVKRAFQPYTNVKFAPYENKCGTDINAGDWCIMRAEEMLLIQAEAMAMGGNLGGGKSLLENWVKTYRDPSYSCAASTPEAFQSEIWWQRRVELWGEGFATFDIKRFEKGITRSYAGTNHPKGYRWNTDGVPDWMNLCIVGTEVNFNQACTNNPTPIQPTEDSPEKVW